MKTKNLINYIIDKDDFISEDEISMYYRDDIPTFYFYNIRELLSIGFALSLWPDGSTRLYKIQSVAYMVLESTEKIIHTNNENKE